MFKLQSILTLWTCHTITGYVYLFIFFYPNNFFYTEKK